MLSFRGLKQKLQQKILFTHAKGKKEVAEESTFPTTIFLIHKNIWNMKFPRVTKAEGPKLVRTPPPRRTIYNWWCTLHTSSAQSGTTSVWMPTRISAENMQISISWRDFQDTWQKAITLLFPCTRQQNWQVQRRQLSEPTPVTPCHRSPGDCVR